MPDFAEELAYFADGLYPNTQSIKAWQRYHSFHLRNPFVFPPIYFILAILHLCGGDHDAYFYVSEDVYQNFRARPEYQLRLARYVCSYYKCHTWPLLFEPWTQRQFTNYVRHLIGKYNVPLWRMNRTNTHSIEKRMILFSARFADYLIYFTQPIGSPDLPALPLLPSTHVGRPKRHVDPV